MEEDEERRGVGVTAIKWSSHLFLYSSHINGQILLWNVMDGNLIDLFSGHQVSEI